MEPDFQSLSFPYRRAPDQSATTPVRYPVVVVGAGPVGLATAIDLAQGGMRVLLLDDDGTLSSGSRAICFAKRSLEIFDRLGCGQRMVDKGVSWNVGRVFLRDQQLYAFDVQPESAHARPGFINLQQYYVEGYLTERAAQLPTLSLRWHNRVIGLEPHDDYLALSIETPDGPYRVHADFCVAADGTRSALRKMLGLNTQGRTFQDRFLIADVKMRAPFPAERWFWFDPPFHPNQSVLLHRQPDDVWRIDFQLGWDADPVLEKQPERVIPRVQALLGPDAEFELQWVSVYTFACQRMAHFRHGRVLFAGDAAHGVSPFGARGANSGVQDADNLAWKLRLVMAGHAPDSLLDSYAAEREYAADENILNSTRATDFITPKSAVSRVFRDAVLSLAKECDFARRLVNSGRLSVPAILRESPLNTADCDKFIAGLVPGAPCADAPIGASRQWLLRALGEHFTALLFLSDAEWQDGLGAARLAELHALAAATPVPIQPLLVLPPGRAPAAAAPFELLEDPSGVVSQRYDGQPGTLYLIRPDQHVCARWRQWRVPQVLAALATALGHGEPATRAQRIAEPGVNAGGADHGAGTRHVSPALAAATGGSAMGQLHTEARLSQADEFYAALIDMHRDLTPEQSQMASARLILLLSNQIADLDILRAAMQRARADLEPAP